MAPFRSRCWAARAAASRWASKPPNSSRFDAKTSPKYPANPLPAATSPRATRPIAAGRRHLATGPRSIVWRDLPMDVVMNDAAAGALRTALQSFSEGRVAAAREMCRGILRASPDHAGALHLLGVMAHGEGDRSAACVLLRRA